MARLYGKNVVTKFENAEMYTSFVLIMESRVGATKAAFVNTLVFSWSLSCFTCATAPGHRLPLQLSCGDTCHILLSSKGSEICVLLNKVLDKQGHKNNYGTTINGRNFSNPHPWPGVSLKFSVTHSNSNTMAFRDKIGPRTDRILPDSFCIEYPVAISGLETFFFQIWATYFHCLLNIFNFHHTLNSYFSATCRNLDSIRTVSICVHDACLYDS